MFLAALLSLCVSLATGTHPGHDGDPDSPRTIARVGIIGCHKQNHPSPALDRYVEAKPDLVLWVGDNVYADTKDDPTYIERCYAMLAAKPAFSALRDITTFMAVWDDHDYGMNNDGKNYPLKHASREIFRRFWKHQERIPENRPGVYHASIFGPPGSRLQVIMLDTRFNRDDEGDESDTLGEAQWAWLGAQLRRPAEVRLIVSGYQVLLDRETKFETWAKFPAAQRRLFDLIRDTGARGVVFIAGDQHYGEVSRLRGALGGYDAVELMFSGINQEEPHVFNSSRVSPVAHAKDAYALIDIQWQGTKGDNADPPHLLFRCFDAVSNAVELTYRINLDELGPAPGR
ncbi:MAG: alkaline phosphatase family protein [Phycisphaeraceae bacterium]|nr:alkaline phosphatase family protein [Phycisphaeraceae bacterium]